MQVKENIKVSYDDTENLKELIEEVYLDGEPYGKISKNPKKLKIESPLMKTILLDMDDYEVKIINSIIDGSMKFEIIRVKDGVYLLPISIYCVKKNDNKDYYSFY